ncbi:HAMP domain-containing sensor histidine kinase [Kribbella albertanoniae]
MRRRLLQSLVPMVVLLAIIATVPLANFIATSASRTLFLSRSNDADWFATMAEAPLQSGDIANLREMAVRYDDLYNTPVFIVDDNNKVVATSKSGVDTNEPDIAIALGSTLAWLPAEPPALWPWQSGEMVVARPVANNGRILGAAVLRVPTDDNRLEVRRSLILLLIGLLISIGAIIAGIVRPISRWVINPVKDLDNATHQITRGALDTRVSTDGRAPELRRLGDSFNSMALSLHQARQREREFVADASHQLRTPLTSARIHIEGLSRLSPTARFALSDIDRLGRIVQRLSRLAGSDRPGADAEGNSEEPLDLAQAVKERLVGWKAVYAADDLELIIGDMVPGGVAPELEVDDILDVLLDNASKYGAPPVEVSVTRDGTEVVLSVRDHGLGLGSRDLKKVGERFWRSAHHREMPGTGLGLAIVRSEAARVGGRVVARPPIGGGLVIEVRVPLIDDYEL